VQKLINVTTEPYEFTWNAGHYGPFQPGVPFELPDEVAAHARRHSAILDDMGGAIGYRVDYLKDVAADKLKNVMLYECPMAQAGRCAADPFKTIADLKAHLESHLTSAAPPPKPSEAARR
jgi:hypothetical protein